MERATKKCFSYFTLHKKSTKCSLSLFSGRVNSKTGRKILVPTRTTPSQAPRKVKIYESWSVSLLLGIMLKRRLSAFQIVCSVYGTRGQGPRLLNYLYKSPKTQFEATGWLLLHKSMIFPQNQKRVIIEFLIVE